MSNSTPRPPRCPKCDGCQVSEALRGESQAITQVRCLNCGRIEEPGHTKVYRLYNGYGTYGKAYRQANHGMEA